MFSRGLVYVQYLTKGATWGCFDATFRLPLFVLPMEGSWMLLPGVWLHCLESLLQLWIFGLCVSVVLGFFRLFWRPALLLGVQLHHFESLLQLWLLVWPQSVSDFWHLHEIQVAGEQAVGLQALSRCCCVWYVVVLLNFTSNRNPDVKRKVQAHCKTLQKYKKFTKDYNIWTNYRK